MIEYYITFSATIKFISNVNFISIFMLLHELLNVSKIIYISFRFSFYITSNTIHYHNYVL